MPTRLLREGILESPRVDQLSELAELFYRRLMSLADDHGLYHAHPTRLRSNAYPMRIDRYSDDQVRAWRDECAAAGLLRLYRVRGVEYLQLLDWRQQVKAKPKFPAPDSPGAEPFTPPGGPGPEPPTGPGNGPCTGRARTDDDPPPAREPPGNDPVALGEGVDVGEGGVVTRARATRAPARTIPEQPSSWAEWASWWQQVRGVETTVRDRIVFVPLAQRWIARKVTTGQMLSALERAEAKADEPIAYLPAYVDRVLSRSQAPPRNGSERTESYLDVLDAIADGITPTEVPDDHEPGPARLGR